MTSRFGSGWIIDGSHPRIRVGPHKDLRKGVKNLNKFEQQKPRGFKRGSGRTSHHTSVAGIRDRGAKDQGWALRGSGIFTNVPKGWAEGEEQEESQGFSSSSSNSPGGRRDFKNLRREEHRRARTARDIATKGEATWKDIDFGSTWQNGPGTYRGIKGSVLLAESSRGASLRRKRSQ